MLRAAFIQFDNGNLTEAFRLVKLLAQAAEKSKIKPSEQVQDFIVVAKGATDTPAYWQNWHAWWPQWQQIETLAGLDPVKDHKVLPVIPSLSDLGKDMGTANKDHDVKRFFGLLRQLAYAARCYPNAAEELVGVLPTAEEVLPDHANELRLLAIAMLEPLVPSEPNEQRQRILNLLINYVDSNQNSNALELMAREWKPEIDDESSVARAIHRLWAYAAVAQHQDLEKVKDIMEKDLQSADAPNRSRTVDRLADIYVGLGHMPDAEHLLELELANPIIMADSDAQKDIKTRLENVRSVAEASQQLTDGVALWLKDNKPDWWDYAEPKSPDDSRLTRLEEILNNPNGEFQSSELVRASLFAPAVASLSPAVQQQAVLNAFNTLYDDLATQDGADGFTKSIIDNPSLPPSLKRDFLFRSLLEAASNQHLASFQSLKKLPLFETMTAPEAGVIDRVESFSKADRTLASALTAYVQNSAQHPMDSLDLGIAQDTVGYLLKLGEVDSAESIYHAAANYSIASNATTTKPAFQLSLLKQINAAKQIKPITDALRQVVLSTIKPETIAKPATFDQRRDLIYFFDLTEADATSFRLYLIKIHQEPLDLGFWWSFMLDQPHNAAGHDLNYHLLKAGLENAATDDLKVAISSWGTSVLDTDDPDLRQKFIALTQPYRDPVKFPQMTENMRMFDVEMALRLGKRVNLETDLAGFTSSTNVYQALRLKIRAELQMKDWPKLKELLNHLSADQMTSPRLVRDVLPALEAVGMKDEAELARDILNKKLYQDVLEAWLIPTGVNLEAVQFDMGSLNSTQGIQEAFATFAQSHVARQKDWLEFALLKAYLDKDWSAAATAGAAYTQAYPTYYSAYWYYGKSLAELGKKEEAIKALTVYCQYSPNEVSYPEAKALLDKLNTPDK